MHQITRTGEGGETIKQNCIRLENGQELEYLTFPALEETGLVEHLVTTRLGGVSTGELATMNLSFTRGDREENVLENYRRIGRVLGCGMEDMVTSHQTHTVNIRHVRSADRGKGIVAPRDYENIDGLVTDEEGIALVTFYADCVPLLFLDPVHRAIGLAHSGWRGTVDRMGKHMTEAMEEAFGSKPAELIAAVGPSICRECYEVGEEVAERFWRLFGGKERCGGVVTEGRAAGKYQLDLWLANRLILEEAGIPHDRISVTDICTCHNSDYLFSHRGSNGHRGNLGVFLMLKNIVKI
ncbi:MAG: peptidoglycan editing factor PgeF [Lachnospiraceae bacterium]|nr:peptidoglycan editing factor PgeF [Lachnospiraceae bacterium]MCM1239716.1 peptidoglycan editing factor PgeF [Lachnospiraceae bacterium]MCM1303020.1 peptidoglycan editing factor PgeF [Butyrivibrio sp.]MCM1345231.1 peptidoglycan editing factor PgeF [Muribaculaceae bacterium]MCM1410510.1 peptidoglycan editing factor PgeF [Lachnospiraceae bacterium]